MYNFISVVGEYSNVFYYMKALGRAIPHGNLKIENIDSNLGNYWSVSDDHYKLYTDLELKFQLKHQAIDSLKIWILDFELQTATWNEEGYLSEVKRLEMYKRQLKIEDNKQHNYVVANTMSEVLTGLKSELLTIIKNDEDLDIVNASMNSLHHQVLAMNLHQFNEDNPTILTDDILNLDYSELTDDAFYSFNVLRILVEREHNEQSHTIDSTTYNNEKILELVSKSGVSTLSSLTGTSKMIIDYYMGNASLVKKMNELVLDEGVTTLSITQSRLLEIANKIKNGEEL